MLWFSRANVFMKNINLHINILLIKLLTEILVTLVLISKDKTVVLLFGADILHQKKAQ